MSIKPKVKSYRERFPLRNNLAGFATSMSPNVERQIKKMCAEEIEVWKAAVAETHRAYEPIVEALIAAEEYIAPRVKGKGVTGRTIVLPKIRAALGRIDEEEG